jgi:hypothetical protein
MQHHKVMMDSMILVIGQKVHIYLNLQEFNQTKYHIQVFKIKAANTKI